MMGAPAYGQTVATAPPSLPDRGVHGAPGPDGLSPDELLVQAREVVRDDKAHTLTAKGSVEARYKGRLLRAENLTYDTQTGVVVANGKAEIINEDGGVQYAEHVVLDDKLRAGVATGFAARLDGGAKLAAASAVRRSETVNELNRAIFTPCEICAKSGAPKEPSWSIQAERVIQDRNRLIVYYQNAIIRVKGVPVFYAPVFWHPDPSAPRASGFLMPQVSVSGRRGVSYEQAYLWAISPSEDLTVAPQINGKVNPLLNLGWRKRFWSGSVEAWGGITYDRNFDSEGEKFGDSATRSYLLASGAFDVTQKWRWGFGVGRASDDTLFDRYDIDHVDEKRGLFADDRRRLTSQAFAIRQDDRSYFSISALSFQSLRPFVDPLTGNVILDPVTRRALFENDPALPVVAPLVEARWSPSFAVLGGRLRFSGSAVAIERDQASLDPRAPATPGVDSRRATVQAEWRSSLFTPQGLRLDPFLSVRGDYYSLSDLAAGKDASIGRSLATAGLEARYPLARRAGEATVVVEPIAQLVASPRRRPDPRIPNEDSQSLAFDESDLFRPDRFSGFDLYESGARLNVGARATVTWDDGRWARLMVGRTLRDRDDPAFPAGSGLGDRASDWVVAANGQIIDGVLAVGRARIDDAGRLRRVEAGANWTFDRTRGFVRYFSDEDDAFVPGRRKHDLEAAGEVSVIGPWGVSFDVSRDLERNLWRRSELGLLYQDDCLKVALVYQRNETAVLATGATVRPTDAVFLRLSLATLGGSGYAGYNDR